MLTMSVQASKTLVGKPADLNMFCMVVTGQCHQRRCNFRISRCRTASSGDLKARKLVVKLNRVQSFVVAEPEAASLVVTRGALDVDEDDVLSRRVPRHGGVAPSPVLTESSRRVRRHGGAGASTVQTPSSTPKSVPSGSCAYASVTALAAAFRFSGRVW